MILALIAIIAIIAIGGFYFPRPSQEVVLGGGTRFINGLSTISTSPNAGQILTTNIGIGSTSPSTSFGISLGTSGATTTIFANKLCIVAQTPQPGGSSGGQYLYYTISTSSTAANGVGGWATSTTPCY